MDEVDGIIVHHLRSLGCGFEEDVQSLSQFSPEMVVEATARCLRAIDSTVDVHYKLPPSMAARFKVGTSLATAVQALGFKEQIGYHTFLYSNAVEIRRVLMFLIDRLPRDHSESLQEPLGSMALLQKTIGAEIAKRLSSPWILPILQTQVLCGGHAASHSFSTVRLTTPADLHDLRKPPTAESRKYYKTAMQLVDRQPRRHIDLTAAIFERNMEGVTREHEWEMEWSQQGLATRLSPLDYKARKSLRVAQKISDQLRSCLAQVQPGCGTGFDGRQDLVSSGALPTAGNQLVKGSRFSHIEKLQFAQADDVVLTQICESAEGARTSEQEQQAKRAEELQQLTDRLSELTSRADSLESDARKFAQAMQQMTDRMKTLEEERAEKERLVELKRKTIDLLPNATSNLEELQAAVEASRERLANLAKQWERHRVPLVERLQELKELSDTNMSDTQRKLNEIADIEVKLKELISEAREKDELCKQLEVEFERMTKDVNRSAYTRRILEIVANIRKQNQDIDKVLVDTRGVQKEINQLSGKLDRTFIVTDELIFKDAKRDEAARKAYKQLAALHENCSILIKTIEETGAIAREIRDFEDLVEAESQTKIDANLEQITVDYHEMKNENTVLLNKVKQLQGN